MRNKHIMIKFWALLVFWSVMLSMGTGMLAEEYERYVSIDDLQIGDHYSKVIRTLENKGVRFEVFEEDEGYTSVEALLDVWGFQDYSEASFLFDKEGKLVIIESGLFDVKNIAEIYSAISSRLGGAEAINIPFVDYDTDESTYVEYMIPVFVRWNTDDVIFELTVEIVPYTDITSDFWGKTQINVDDDARYSFGVLICDHNYYDPWYE